MGVPAFFRWLSKKYAAIVVHCHEEKEKSIDGTYVPVDLCGPNPNDVEFDNLYLDMNGIIHPCCHPENKPAPKDEDEMMVAIFEYIDRLMRIVRPRKLLYMAIDGVAPRAKMNQQRSRRFRASKESRENKETMSRIREEILTRGGNLPPPKPASSHFDSNCITPGTEFMFRLADCLRYYVTERLNNNPGWADLKVILSDANAPGEGEHKIMDYIRRQRAQPDHDPNTHHCLCGADADLIMLGLATHEPYFTIIREEFKPNQKRPCELCNQIGHELKECEGLPREKMGEHDELASAAPSGEETQFIFLRLNILREYLEKELWMTGLPFTFDVERAIDDWVFMCFFVGNDFLPHLPSLEIREGAIDRLIRLYKKAVYKTKGYLTENGIVNLHRVQLMMTDLGEAEDEIFRKRRDTELGFRRRNKEKKQRMAREQAQGSFVAGGFLSPQAIGNKPSPSSARDIVNARHSDNMSAAANLRSSVGGPGFGSQEQKGTKRKREEVDADEEADKADTVRLWESGWKERYYQNKFDVKSDDVTFRDKVVEAYVSGLCWVLQYYYQGCPSWNWYFPFHYAPFASDFIDIARVPNMFPKGTKPFKPLEQLMSVFPAASGNFLPDTWRTLMMDIDSPIIDFYPSDFKVDLNGKKYAWQGVALLPFVEEKRLLTTLEEVYPNLLAVELKRNSLGPDRLFVGKKNSLFSFFNELYNSQALDKATQNVEMSAELAHGMRGMLGNDEFVTMPGRFHRSPVPGCLDIPDSQVLCVTYKDPQYGPEHLFQAKQLPGAKPPAKVLKPEDFEEMERQGRGRGRGRGGFRGRGRGGGQGWRPQLGFTPSSGYRDNKSADSANRMISPISSLEQAQRFQAKSWRTQLLSPMIPPDNISPAMPYSPIMHQQSASMSPAAPLYPMMHHKSSAPVRGNLGGGGGSYGGGRGQGSSSYGRSHYGGSSQGQGGGGYGGSQYQDTRRQQYSNSAPGGGWGGGYSSQQRSSYQQQDRYQGSGNYGGQRSGGGYNDRSQQQYGGYQQRRNDQQGQQGQRGGYPRPPHNQQRNYNPW